MRKYITIFYLLFILLVMGTFASMAQNSYGLKIMGGVAFLFGLVFIVEFISILRKNDEKDRFVLIELACLCLLSVIFGFRVFYIHFPYIELLFGAAATLLALIYLMEMILRFRHFQKKNKLIAIVVIVYHLSIILFLGSLAMIPFAPKIAEFTGAAALILLAVFIIAGLFLKDLLVDGENISVFKIIRRFKGHSIIIVTLFLLFFLYVGFNRIGVLPDIYSDEFPRAYFELVDKATSKKEKPVDGKYKHEEFLEKYQRFLRHHKTKGQ